MLDGIYLNVGMYSSLYGSQQRKTSIWGFRNGYFQQRDIVLFVHVFILVDFYLYIKSAIVEQKVVQTIQKTRNRGYLVAN